MKSFVCFIFTIFLFNYMEAQVQKKIFPHLKNKATIASSMEGAVSYVHFSNSINGPFSSPQTILTTDSLFLKMDVSPLGSVVAEYFLDVNENNIIDANDFSFGFDTYVDNNTMPPGMIDLDPTPGIIISYIDPEQAPSMQVLVRATEGLTTVSGILIFENPPASFTMSGKVYSKKGGVVPGAMIWMFGSGYPVGDVTNIDGDYSLPIDAGTYQVWLQDLVGNFSPFDTTIVITGNTMIDFYLSPLSSYIRGFVKDEQSNPIPHVGVRTERGGYTETDSIGEYKLFVPTGYGRIGLNPESLYPTYLIPWGHEYMIGENDSIVDNDTSNFTCFKANSSITGTVREQGNLPTHQYLIFGLTEQIRSFTFTISDNLGNYSLPTYQSQTMPMYGVWLADWDERYPIPPGMYVDTSYWNLAPGSVANFNILAAETLFIEHFDGNFVEPSAMWETYSYNNPWGYGVIKQIVNNQLVIKCVSQSGLSGLGVVSRKPFNMDNREYRLFIDHTHMDTTNSIEFVLSDEKRNWDYTQNLRNSIHLIWENEPLGNKGWRLVEFMDGIVSLLWSTSDTAGSRIVLQFDSQTNKLKLTIDGITKYDGSWGNHLSIAYVYLTQFNFHPDPPSVVIFDDFYVVPIGYTSVREIGGELPLEFKLAQNYPNPFNPITIIKYQIPTAGLVTLKVFNMLGQEVVTLVNEEQKTGSYEATLNGANLPSGVYYYRLVISEATTGKQFVNSVRKAILIK